MKFYITLLVLLLCFTSCSDKKDKKPVDHAKSDWAAFQLQGNVKSAEERSYQIINGKKGQRMREIISDHDTDLFFNEDGQLTKEIKWNTDSKPFEQNIYQGKDHKISLTQYVNGKPAIKTQFSWDKTGKENTAILRLTPDNRQIDRITMMYKANNLIEKRTYNIQDNPSDKIEYRYDQKGNVIEELLYLGSEFVQFRNQFEYNDAKQKVSETRLNKDGKILFKTLFKYENGRLVATETYNDKNEADYIEKNSYDDKGNVIRHYTFEKFDGSETVDEFTFDAAGNKTQWTATRNGQPLIKVAYGYDTHKNLTSVHAEGAQDKPIDDRTYKYTYDKKGNWITRTAQIGNKVTVLTERKIKYFQ